MNKLFLILVLVLSTVIYNSLLLAQEFPPEDKEFREDHFKYLERLNLSEEQKTTFEGFHFKLQKEMIEVNAELQKSELIMQELKSKGEYSREEVLSTVNRINNEKNKIELLRENHKMDIYDELTPEQKKIWNEDMKKIHRFKDIKNFHEKRDFRPHPIF